MTRARWICAMAAALLCVACSDAPTTPGTEPGSLVLRLTTPHADDGALLFQISGPPIDSVTVFDGSLQLFTRREGDSTIVGAVVGTLANGAILRLRVPNVGAAASYAAAVLDVADRQDALRTSHAGYALTVTR